MRVSNRLFSLCIAVLCSGVTFAEDRISVVTTLTTYADIARAIGGTRITAEAIASPRFNPHFIEPRPSDVLRVKRADLFIHSGLDLEAWRGPLVDAAGTPEIRPGGARELDLSVGIRLLDVPAAPVTRAMGDIHLHGNPHYWLAPENGVIIAKHIGAKLAAIDPAAAAMYQQNTADYVKRLQEAMERWRERAAPFKGRAVVAYHDEWVYLTSFMGLTLERFLEPKPGIPPTPQHIEAIEGYIREHSVPAIIQASFHPTDAANLVAARTGATVVRICQNVGELPEAAHYVAMIDFNIRAIVETFR